MSAQPNGIILVTGPTGSGKTVTLYSTLKNLATPEVNVCTLEDPIEMIEGSFNQVQMPGHRHGLCRGHPLPDAAGPGHHHGRRNPRPGNGRHGDPGGADRPPGAVHPAHQRCAVGDHAAGRTRRAAYLLSATVLGVMAQRLVRTLCPKCKQPGGMRAEDEAAWTALVAPWKSTMPTQLYHPVGCLDCRMTGYKGRVGIYEIMRMSPVAESLWMRIGWS
jgi:general secretion pathway protein E